MMTIEKTCGPANVSISYPAGDVSPVASGSEPAPLLPPPRGMSSDPMTLIAQLLVKSSRQKRESDELSAQVEEQSENAADAKRLEEMKSKASLTFAASVGAGAAQMCAGGCSIVGGARAGTRANAGGEVNLARAKSISSSWDGVSQATSGSGKMHEAIFKRFADEADKADQNIAKAESESKVHKRAAEALHKEVDAASQHEGKVMQLLQEIKQAQQQCERAALIKMA